MDTNEPLEVKVNDNTNPEVETSNSTPEDKPEAFKPWKIKPPEDKPEAAIPYKRFKEINDEKVAYQQQLAKYEAELAKYEERAKTVAAIKTPDDIKLDDYEDPQEYLKARDQAIVDQAVRSVEDKYVARQLEAHKAKQFESLSNTYESNIKEAISRNPEIAEASAFIDEYAQHINPDIAYELMIDENVGELLYDITTNQELLTEMFKGNPQDFIRKLHKMSAKIDRSTRYAKYDDDESPTPPSRGYVPVPKAMDPRDAIRASIPSQVRPTPRATKSVASMSTAEYRVYKANGYK